MSGSVATVLGVLAIGGMLWRIAWRDATRFEVAWGDVLALAVLGAWWQGLDAWVPVLGGVLIGTGAIVGQMVVARARGRRSPVYAGDAMLMGAAGALLGPLGLAVSWLVHVPAGLAYRWWLARRRGRRDWLRGLRAARAGVLRGSGWGVCVAGAGRGIWMGLGATGGVRSAAPRCVPGDCVAQLLEKSIGARDGIGESADG